MVAIDPNRESGSNLSPAELAEWIGANLDVSRTLLVNAQPGKVDHDSLVIDFEVESEHSVNVLGAALSQYGQVSEPMFLEVKVLDKV